MPELYRRLFFFPPETLRGYMTAVQLLPEMGTAGTALEKKIARPIGQLLTRSGSCGCCTHTCDKSLKCATLGILKHYVTTANITELGMIKRK